MKNEWLADQHSNLSNSLLFNILLSGTKTSLILVFTCWKVYKSYKKLIEQKKSNLQITITIALKVI